MFLIPIIAIIFLWDILNQLKDNLPLMLLSVVLLFYVLYFKKIKVSKSFLIVFLFAGLQTLINILLGNDTFALFLKQALSISVCALLFENILDLSGVNKTFRYYWNSAILAAVIAILQELSCLLHLTSLSSLPVVGVLFTIYGNISKLAKVSSVFQEPSFLAYYIAPAVCVAIYYLFQKDQIPEDYRKFIHKKNSIILILGMLFTFSLTAYIGLALILLSVFFSRVVSQKKLFTVVAVLVFAVGVYVFIPDIRLRVNDTLNIFSDSSVTNVNISSFTYFNNFNVMQKSLLSSKLFGNGLGSCPIQFDKFALENANIEIATLNREDANSMFFRLLIELGLPGIIAAIYYLKRYFVGKRNILHILSVSLLILVILIFIRQGNYTHGGFVLFFIMYKKVYEENKRLKMQKEEQGEGTA